MSQEAEPEAEWPPAHRLRPEEPRTPKRKLSVFYRSFDVIGPIQDQVGPVEVRRSSSSPSVGDQGPKGTAIIDNLEMATGESHQTIKLGSLGKLDNLERPEKLGISSSEGPETSRSGNFENSASFKEKSPGLEKFERHRQAVRLETGNLGDASLYGGKVLRKIGYFENKERSAVGNLETAKAFRAENLENLPTITYSESADESESKNFGNTASQIQRLSCSDRIGYFENPRKSDTGDFKGINVFQGENGENLQRIGFSESTDEARAGNLKKVELQSFESEKKLGVLEKSESAGLSENLGAVASKLKNSRQPENLQKVEYLENIGKFENLRKLGYFENAAKCAHGNSLENVKNLRLSPSPTEFSVHQNLDTLKAQGCAENFGKPKENYRNFSSTSSSSSSPEHEKYSKNKPSSVSRIVSRTNFRGNGQEQENGNPVRFSPRQSNFCLPRIKPNTTVPDEETSTDTEEEEAKEFPEIDPRSSRGPPEQEQPRPTTPSGFQEHVGENEIGKPFKRPPRVRRSLSEGNSVCKPEKETSKQQENGNEWKVPAFPSFTEIRLKETGLTNLPEIDAVYRENIPDEELERKYTAFSIGLGTDRITLSRRLTLSTHQRNLAEKNLESELEKMRQEIHDLWPLCTDRDSIEKVEAVQRRAEMVVRCGRRISCVAETLGATREEEKVSRAVLIADKYLQLLRARCENLAAELSEYKRILLKNNIVLEENTELTDDLPRIRYRTSVPSNNRTMIARRRASIATISRPLTSPQDAKDGPKQRNSVSGRVTIRRPSLCAEPPRLETEKLHVADFSPVELADESKDPVEENNNNNFQRLESRQGSADRGDFLEETWQRPQDLVPTLEIDEKEPKRRKNSLARDFPAWPSVFRCIGIFFLGFLANNLIYSAGSD